MTEKIELTLRTSHDVFLLIAKSGRVPYLPQAELARRCGLDGHPL
ncbi:MAG: hypothetical protein PHS41_09165 [Victivallaceae bacterium]|nr:hypothetical protein [Victivallaceae bacterium]